MEMTAFEEFYTNIEEVECPECGNLIPLTIQGGDEEEDSEDTVTCSGCFRTFVPETKNN